ncbi:MAG TPA: hypothetical protein VNT99_07000, partial [Methylomirabilota bacterium]|nr:hypothetical protein [Methylomirabilota bacterium]
DSAPVRPGIEKRASRFLCGNLHPITTAFARFATTTSMRSGRAPAYSIGVKIFWQKESDRS